MDKKVIERLKYAKTKNPKSQIRLSINAILLTEKISLAIAEVVDYLYLSVQGGITNKDRYEKVTGFNYSRMYENIIDFIEKIEINNYNLKIFNIAINNVIPFENETALAVEREFWEKKELRRLILEVFLHGLIRLIQLSLIIQKTLGVVH